MGAGSGIPRLGPVVGLSALRGHDLRGAPVARAMAPCRVLRFVPVPGAGQVLRPKPSRRPSR